MKRMILEIRAFQSSLTMSVCHVMNGNESAKKCAAHSELISSFCHYYGYDELAKQYS